MKFKKAVAAWGVVGLLWVHQAMAAPFSVETHDVYSGDFNGDGKGDLLVIAKNTAGLSGIYATDASGQPTTQLQSWNSGFLGINWQDSRYTAVIGNFNGVGGDDVLLQRNGTGTSFLLPTNSQGELFGISQYINGWGTDSYRIVAGKFDGNARADVFLQARQSSGSSSVILSDGAGQLTITNQTWANNHLGFKWSVANAVVHAGDFNGDGRDDLLVQAKAEIALIDFDIPIPVPVYKPNTFGITLATTAGQFTSIHDVFSRNELGLDFAPNEFDIVVGDFNGDGRDDILLLPRKAGKASAAVLTDANGQLTQASVTNLGAGTLGAELRTLVADFNGDGRSELYRVASTGGGSNTIVSFTSSGSIAANVVHSPPPISNNMGKLVGRLPGEFAVDTNGAATYEIPLDVPEGTNGLSPDLSFVYSSMSDGGDLGAGWNLSGLSAVTRCPSTLEQDGVIRGVQLNNDDRFCLDGNRLRVTGGSYGGDGSTYQTELETAARVTSYLSGGSGYVPSSGPQYFRTETKDGLYLFYGTTADSRIEVTGTSMPKLWALNRVQDRDGNFMTITYTKGANGSGFNGSFRPATIEWARTAAGTGPFFRVVFVYQNRPASDVDVSYFAGGYSVEDKLVDRVEVQALEAGNWVVVRQYDLTYEQSVSSTGRSRLASITQCSTTDCLPATTFQYQNGGVGWVNSDISYPADMAAIMAASHAIDIDGDARTDLVFPKNGTWWFMRSTGSGYAAAQNSSVQAGTNPNNFFQVARATRRLQSNNAGLLIRNNNANLQILRWNGSTLVQSPTSIPASMLTGNQWVADFDGDGIDDFLYPQVTSGQAQFFLRRGYNVGFGEIDFASAELMVTTSVDGAVVPMTMPDATDFIDVNADGKADVFFETTAGSTRRGTVLVSGLNGFTALPAWDCLFDGTLPTGIHCNSLATLGDFNGDSLTDVMYPTRSGGSSRVEMRFGSGVGLSAATVLTLPVPLFVSSLFAIDFDNDGRTDIVGPDCGPLCAYRFNGAGFDAPVTVGQGFPFVETGTLRQVDIDGNGQVDLAYQVSKVCLTTAACAVAGQLRVRVHSGAEVAPDLLTRATDGFGNFAAPVYAPLTDATVYTKGSGGLYPTVDLLAPMFVVKDYSANSGIASPASYSVSYRYKGARAHLRGRGFVGFEERTRIDNRAGNQLRTVETYKQDFPYIGNVAASTVYQPDGTTRISTVANTYQSIALGSAGSARVLPYLRTATEAKYEAGGPNNGELITSSTTTNSVDEYGNVLAQEVVAKDDFAGSPLNGSLYRALSDNIFEPNTAQWCVAAVKEARVKSQPAGASAYTTRSKLFVVDPAKCRATQEKIEPGDAKLQVTTDIGYYPSGHPSAGQISSRTVTGINMQPRITSFEYHASGPLVTKTTDALGHTNSSEWNAGLEFQTAAVDLNGKRLEYGADSLGRKTSELRPDGIRVDFRYFGCSTGCGLATGEFQLVTSTSAQGALIEQGATIHDALGRTIQSTNWLFGGLQSHVLTEYDVMGRGVRKSAPFFTGTPTYWANTTYDLVGRPLSEQRQISETDSSLQSLTWSHEGLRMRQTDANGKVIVQRKDAINRTVQVTDAAGTHTWYEYDAFGNALRAYVGDGNGVATPGTIITNQYDLRGRKKRSDDPDMGVWTYEFDALDQLTSQTDAKNQTITQGYDRLGRLTSRGELEGNSSWTYDTASNGIGLLHTVTSPGGYAEIHGYDALGRHVNETTTIDGTQYLVTAAYNALGQVETIEYPQSFPANYRFKVRFVYDYGLLKRVEDATSSNTVYWQAVDTDAAGEVINEQLGNGIGTTSWFDNVSGVLRQRNSGLGYSSTVQALQYQWDRQGNLTQRRDQNQNTTENFYYDSLYRLDYSTLTVSGTTVTNLDLSYDALGNITSMTGNGTYNYHPTKKHAVVSTSSGQVFGYDANGSMINRNGSTIDWYSYNLPKKLRDGTDSAEFFYNADRDRYKQIAISSDGTETTTYIGSLLERVVKPNGVIEFKHSIPGADGSAAIHTRRSNGVSDTRYLTTDHLGSVDTITNEAGTVLARLNYDAFGKRRNFSANDLTVVKAVTHIGFTGQEMLDNIDLVHMNGRVYDPLTGRFISADPFVQDPLNSQSLNRYSYVANNPLSLIDPSGFSFLSKIGKGFKKAIKSLVKGVTRVFAAAAAIVVTAACLYGSNGGGAGACIAAGAEVYVKFRIALGDRGAFGSRGPPSGNVFDAPPGPSLPPGTIVFIGAPTQGVDVDQSQGEDTLGQVLLEVGIDLLKNGIIPIDAIQTLFNPNSTWKERALATLEIGVALSPAKAAQLAKALFKAGKRIKAAASRTKIATRGCRRCFAKGTEVVTREGPKPIENVKVGDEVLAGNEETGKSEYKPVLKVFVNPDRPIWEVTIADEKGAVDSHRVTADHPYWVKQVGWLPVAALAAGMSLSASGGEDLRIVDVHPTSVIETTYNMEVAGLHTFFVGRQQVLVHNTGFCGINLSVDQLSQAAAVPDRGGFSKAGRSLTKHGNGARPGNGKFPQAKGSPKDVNRQAQDQVDDILTIPGSSVQRTYRGRFGDTIEIEAPDGRGIVFDANGNFLFFKE
jgi:RHS repeat-associated protein